MRELPPTAGMLLQWSDFFKQDNNLEAGLDRYFKGKTKTRILSSGSAALVIILKALKSLCPDKKEVILPAFTCPLVAIACAQAGLAIKLCDLSCDGYDFDLNQMSSLMNEKTLCVIATHLGGLPQSMIEIKKLAKQKNIWVVEDAAQAFGATLDDIPAGLSGDVGFFSLTAGKGLTIFEGGVIACSNDDLLQAIDRQLQENIKSDLVSEIILSIKLIGYKLFYNPIGLSIVYGAALRAKLKNGDIAGALDERFPLNIPIRRVGAFRRSVGLSALARLDEFTTDKDKHAHRLIDKLKNVSSFEVLESKVSNKGCFAYVLVRLKNAAACTKALDKLWSQGLGISKAFAYQLTNYDYLKSIVPEANCPNAEAFASETLTITNSQYLKDSDLEQIKDALCG